MAIHDVLGLMINFSMLIVTVLALAFTFSQKK